MKLAERIIKDIDEAQHHNTKVRNLEGMGSRKARLTVKEANKMIAEMLDSKHPAPNPKTELDKGLLEDVSKLLEFAMTKLKPVKETKKKKG